MRVGVVIGSHTPDMGGGYTFESDLLEGLIAAAGDTTHRFCVLSPPSAMSSLDQRLNGSGIDLRPLSFSALDRGLMRLLRHSALMRAHWRRPSSLDRAAAQAGVDMIWFLGVGSYSTDLPYITVVWDLQHRVTPWFPEVSAHGLWDERELAYEWFLQRASAVITGTRVGQAELERFYQLPPDRVHLLPHPTPRFALDAESTDHANIARRFGIKGKYIIYPAQFWPHKNHVNLIHALALLRSQHGVSLELVLVGSDKGNRAHIQSLALELDVSDSVHFLGFVSRVDLVGLYRGALALTYVSWCGPENLPPLEAFALGCPVVATRVPGAEEQFGQAALLVDPANPQEMAHAVKSLLDNPGSRARLIAAGRERAQRWTARDYVQGVFSILDRFEPVLRCWRPGHVSR